MDIRKSGDNLKLLLTGETYDDTFVGTVTSPDTGQVPITNDLGANMPANNTIPCWQVLVQADPDNTANVLVGNQRHGCFIVLRAGESITIPVNRVEKIFVVTVAAGGDQTVNWLAML